MTGFKTVTTITAIALALIAAFAGVLHAAPTITVTYPPGDNATVAEKTIVIKGYIADEAGLTDVIINGAGHSVSQSRYLDFEKKITLKDGKNTIIVSALNSAGETTDKEIHIQFSAVAEKQPAPTPDAEEPAPPSGYDEIPAPPSIASAPVVYATATAAPQRTSPQPGSSAGAQPPLGDTKTLPGPLPVPASTPPPPNVADTRKNNNTAKAAVPAAAAATASAETPVGPPSESDLSIPAPASVDKPAVSAATATTPVATSTQVAAPPESMTSPAPPQTAHGPLPVTTTPAQPAAPAASAADTRMVQHGTQTSPTAPAAPAAAKPAATSTAAGKSGGKAPVAEKQSEVGPPPGENSQVITITAPEKKPTATQPADAKKPTVESKPEVKKEPSSDKRASGEPGRPLVKPSATTQRHATAESTGEKNPLKPAEPTPAATKPASAKTTRDSELVGAMPEGTKKPFANKQPSAGAEPKTEFKQVPYPPPAKLYTGECYALVAKSYLYVDNAKDAADKLAKKGISVNIVEEKIGNTAAFHVVLAVFLREMEAAMALKQTDLADFTPEVKKTWCENMKFKEPAPQKQPASKPAPWLYDSGFSGEAVPPY